MRTQNNSKGQFSDCRRHIAADDLIFIRDTIHVTQTGFLGGTPQLKKSYQ